MSEFENPIANLARLSRLSGRAETRMRLSAGLSAFVTHLAIALVAVAATLGILKTVPGFSGRIARDVLAGAALSVVIGTAWAASRRLPKLAGAMALECHHGLAGRLSNALAFAAFPQADRTALMDLAIDDACGTVANLSARKACPIGWPRDLPVAIAIGAGVALVALLEVRVHRPASTAKTIDPVALSADDIDLFREEGKRLALGDKSPEVLAALEQYNRLVEDLAQKRLDRTEAFRRLEEIEKAVFEGRARDREALDEQIARRAEALKKSPLAAPAAEALKAQDLDKADKAMRDLAKKLRKKPDPPSKAELDRLRDALKKASEGQKERLAAIDQRREELRQLLNKREERADAGARDQEQQSLLEKRERELERLDRERERQDRAGRQLDRLDRNLAQAAEDILRDLGMSANDLDQAAEDINRMAREKMTDQEREELRQRLEDLREQLRQQGQGGAERLARLRRFMRQARGEGQQGEGQQGDGEKGKGQGKGQGEGEGEQMLELGPGERMLVIERSPGAGRSGQGKDPGGADQSGGHGKEPGHGHDPNLVGKETNPKMGTIDVQASGLDSGQGKSRSEVILGAAEKGFRGGAYKRVYGEYRTSAERQIHKDQIPPGTNDHIRRYFDLIRPRE